ncbi:hypothetical protein ACU8KH_03634 [Lachancea thermotolerans]
MLRLLPTRGASYSALKNVFKDSYSLYLGISAYKIALSISKVRLQSAFMPEVYHNLIERKKLEKKLKNLFSSLTSISNQWHVHCVNTALSFATAGK